MKKLFIGVLFGCLLGISASIALADSPIRIIINGKEVSSDVAPVNVDGRVLVPIRVIAENLNCDVSWDQATQTVTITKKEDATMSEPESPVAPETPIQPVQPTVSSNEYTSSDGVTHIKNYRTKSLAIKLNDEVYVTTVAGLEYYGIPIEQVKIENRTMTFLATGLVVHYSDELSSDNDIVVYEGVGYIKESILQQQAQAIQAAQAQPEEPNQTQQ